MPTYTGINHLAMATSDMDKTIRYWRDLLGMRLTVAMGHDQYKHYFFEITEHDCIAFFEWPEVEPVEERDHGTPYAGPRVFDHISFGIAEREELWELKNRLEVAGFWASEVIDHGFILSLYSFDPNGIPVEFSWKIPGRDTHEQPLMADRHPTRTALLGPDPVLGHWPEPSMPIPEEDRVAYPGEIDSIDANFGKPWPDVDTE